jgi:alpha-galactosidase
MNFNLVFLAHIATSPKSQRIFPMTARKIVLIGAGSASFTQGLVADMILTGEPWDIHLVDINAESLAVAHGVVQRMLAARPAPIQVTATSDRRAALVGADAVVTTFGVGGRRAWELDVFIPRQYGIFQPVGDSVMPGGISRAMRQVPLAVAIARDVAELCPQATFINYANPMSAITRGIRKATGIEVLGLCHGVVHVQSFLANMAGLPMRETALTYIGVNHCTWITKFRHQGRNAWPQIDAILAQEPPALPKPGTPLTGVTPFSWELYQLYGAFPAVLDRHVTEFYPDLCRERAYYGMTLGVDAFSFEGTIANGDASFAKMAAVARGDVELDPKVFAHAPGEHEQLVTILDCLAGKAQGIFSVNLPNAGRLPDIPDEAILEGNTYIDENGVRVLSVGKIPLALRDQIARRAAITELTVDAALSGDPNLMAQAIMADGAVVRPQVALALAQELLKAQAPHLAQVY